VSLPAINFPPVSSASEEGLLAIGGDLAPERILHAYRNGIFPWYSEDSPVLWWSPDPRCVLFPEKLAISSSMKSMLRKGEMRFTVNKAFDEVIRNCQNISRKGQEGTWITKEIVEAYTKLHELGVAHSAEVWHKGEIAGGLYGLKIGKVFFGESMFSKKNNASKYAFIRYVHELQAQGVALVDCQVETEHLKSLGATCIRREQFIGLLNDWCEEK